MHAIPIFKSGNAFISCESKMNEKRWRNHALRTLCLMHRDKINFTDKRG